MRRDWFQAGDGSYYRTCPQILGERRQALRRLRLIRAELLSREFARAWQPGLLRADRIGRRGRVIRQETRS